MLSAELLKSITDRGMSYIVAARLANAPQGIIDQVCKGLGQQDGRMIRVPSAHGDMVCSFSVKRYKKDKHTHERPWPRPNY